MNEDNFEVGNIDGDIEEESISERNEKERKEAHRESGELFEERLKNKDEFPPTETERRVGAYKEMLEPQVREAIITLTEKGYVTIDSGYAPKNIEEGVQYIGFKKGMIDSSFLPAILELGEISEKSIAPSIKSNDRSDCLLLTPRDFCSLEEWKKIFNAIANSFPKRDEPAPISERFIVKKGH